MHPLLHDRAVAGLPLGAGRTELLEEIMSTSVLDETTGAATPRPGRTTRWLLPLSAAAAVAALVLSPAWWQGPEAPTVPAPADQSSQGPGETASDAPQDESAEESAGQPGETTRGHLAVLDDPAWTLIHLESPGEGYGGVSYGRGEEHLEIAWYPADSYASYVEDREHITDPPAPGEPVEVLGLDGQRWSYSADDHTTIREVQDGRWMELRASGLVLPDYLALLEQLRLVDEDGFERALRDRPAPEHQPERTLQQLLEEIRAGR